MSSFSHKSFEEQVALLECKRHAVFWRAGQEKS